MRAPSIRTCRSRHGSTGRLSTDDHVTGVGSPPPRPCQRLAGQPGGALVGPARTVRQERIEKRRGGRTRRTDQAHKALGQIARRAVARVVYDSRSGRGVVSRRRRATSQSAQHLPPERTARPPRLSSNRIVGENLPRVVRQRRADARAAWCQEHAGTLPCQRHGLKLRQRGCVVERRRIPREQQVHTLRPGDPADRRQRRETGWPAGLSRATVITVAARAAAGCPSCDPAGSRSERPWRISDRLGDCQIGMRKRQRHVHALTSQRDRKSSIADNGHRLNEPTHGRPQLSCGAVTSPTRPHVSRRDRRAVGEPGVLPQCDDPGTAVRIELPRRCQAGTDTSMAIRSDQRLVELAEYQSLALVRRMGCVRWIDWVAEANGRDRFARFSDQRTVGGSGLGTERRRRRSRRWRLWRRGNRTRGFWRSVRL